MTEVVLQEPFFSLPELDLDGRIREFVLDSELY